jgi:protease I
MTTETLAGKKIAVLLETEFIPDEIATYQKRFAELGATVHLMSRLWGQEKATFVSDVDDTKKSLHYLDVSIDFQNVNLNDYAAVIMAANYTSVRLRYFEPPKGQPISPEQTRTAPAVQFFAKAMANAKIIKGFLCHGLWILTPMPELLKGRKVICHEVMLADVVNAGAIYVPPPVDSQPNDPRNIVVDRDMVTGRAGHDVEAFIDAIAQSILTSSADPHKPPMPQTIHYPAGPSSELVNHKIPKVDIGKGVLLQIIGEGEQLNAVHWNLPDNSIVASHHHPQQQFGYVIRGSLELTLDGETYLIKEGDSYIIPPNSVHQFRAIGQTEALDVFSPPRDLSTAGGKDKT